MRFAVTMGLTHDPGRHAEGRGFESHHPASTRQAIPANAGRRLQAGQRTRPRGNRMATAGAAALRRGRIGLPAVLVGSAPVEGCGSAVGWRATDSARRMAPVHVRTGRRGGRPPRRHRRRGCAAEGGPMDRRTGAAFHEAEFHRLLAPDAVHVDHRFVALGHAMGQLIDIEPDAAPDVMIVHGRRLRPCRTLATRAGAHHPRGHGGTGAEVECRCRATCSRCAVGVVLPVATDTAIPLAKPFRP